MKDLTAATFEEAVEKTKSGNVMVVDFWATWCAPCRAMIPILTELEKEYGDAVDFCKVNVGDEMTLAAKWMIEAIPRIFIFKEGVVQQTFGPCSKVQLADALDEALGE